MRLIVNLQYMFHRQLGIPLRSRETFVAEQLLNGTQVGALLQHVRAKGVAQRVRVHVGRKSFCYGNFLDDAADTARREAPTAAIDQQRGGVLADCSENLLTLGEISRERRLHRIAKRNIAFFLSLAANENSLGAQANVVEIDSG